MIFSRKLKHFLAVVNHGSITKAAIESNISPSAISQGINELEKNIGIKLLRKTKSGLVLTEEGRVFHHSINPHILAIENLVNRTSKYYGEGKFCIKIDSIYFPSLQRKLIELKRNKIDFNLHTVFENVHDIPYEIKRRKADLVISPLDVEVYDKEIKKIIIDTEVIGIIIHKDLLTKNKTIKRVLANEKAMHSELTLVSKPFCKFEERLLSEGIVIDKMSIHDMDLLFHINQCHGYSFGTESFYNSLKVNPAEILFIKKPFFFDLFINRRAYFSFENIDYVSELLSNIKSFQSTVKVAA